MKGYVPSMQKMQTNRSSNRSWFLSFCDVMAVTVAISTSAKPVSSKWVNTSLHFTHKMVHHKIILHRARVSPAELISLDLLSYRDSSLISEPGPCYSKEYWHFTNPSLLCFAHTAADLSRQLSSLCNSSVHFELWWGLLARDLCCKKIITLHRVLW